MKMEEGEGVCCARQGSVVSAEDGTRSRISWRARWYADTDEACQSVCLSVN
jgi:hypothetical protein